MQILGMAAISALQKGQEKQDQMRANAKNQIQSGGGGGFASLFDSGGPLGSALQSLTSGPVSGAVGGLSSLIGGPLGGLGIGGMSSGSGGFGDQLLQNLSFGGSRGNTANVTDAMSTIKSLFKKPDQQTPYSFNSLF